MTRQASTHRSAKAPGMSPGIPETRPRDGKERGPRAPSPAGLSWSRWQGRDWDVEAAPTDGPG